MVTFEVTTSNRIEPPIPLVMPRANPVSPAKAEDTDFPASESEPIPDSSRALRSSFFVRGRRTRRRAADRSKSVRDEKDKKVTLHPIAYVLYKKKSIFNRYRSY